ncbi:serine/threonine protein kinase [Rubinisphaera margarita]|uniref:serine/threonine protein kinase n=1 Tax=Rubinisphaera margarita TaxID=2909586 RepID=UPI001EE7E96C|nr:serine/threonine-protein kinase [Rubinisphaera margarita]MCG6157481.1 serine/threonine protein kinase [Rubinisphaera margarita]
MSALTAAPNRRPAALRILKQLREMEVITADRLEEILLHWRRENLSVAEGLKSLVKAKELTRFQAMRLYSGKGDSLLLGNYVLVDKIGAGGMGDVYLAEHRRMKRRVALKVLSSKYTENEQMQQRFRREIVAVGRLSHPHIVTAFDADESEGTHFLVMEYIPGEDLGAYVKTHGPLTTIATTSCVLQAARGLQFAHRSHVIHRDIKPQNLLVDAQGQVKILDLGLARFERESQTEDGLTGDGALMGTVDFMAPEQALDTHSADARSDIYSLGCTLFYLLTGNPMYAGSTLVEKVLAHRDEPIPQLPLHIDAELDRIYCQMVAKRPEERYQSTDELIIDLERLLERLQTTETVIDGPLMPSIVSKSSTPSSIWSFDAASEIRSRSNRSTVNACRMSQSTVLVAPPVFESEQKFVVDRTTWTMVGLATAALILLVIGLLPRTELSNGGSSSAGLAIGRFGSADSRAVPQAAFTSSCTTHCPTAVGK